MKSGLIKIFLGCTWLGLINFKEGKFVIFAISIEVIFQIH